MSFDKFDKKIKEAAENHHPNYDESAWQKMEKLLDKHLPQEKTKRRFIFFLVPVLLLGLSAVGYFIYTAKDQQTKFTKFQTGLEKVISDKTVRKNKLPSFKNENANPKDDMEKDMPKSINKNISRQLSSQHKEKYNKKIDNRKIKNTTFQIANENKEIKNDKPVTLNLGRNKLVNTILTFQNKISSNILNPNENENSILISQHDKFALEKTNTNDKSKNRQSGKNEKLNKNKPEKRNYFFFSISAAPDVSYVGRGRLGRVKLLGGIGFGYHWQNGLNFYTGIFKGRKIYNAGPNDYSPPPPFSQYYPILENIDADCKVLEIPIAVDFQFKSKRKNNIFIGAGISSLIMKKEDYKITYKYNPTSPSYSKDISYKNANRHLFSTLTISAGLQHKLDKNLSFTVGPYYKIPLKGIGYGNVKLNSAGINIRLLIHPFFKKN